MLSVYSATIRRPVLESTDSWQTLELNSKIVKYYLVNEAINLTVDDYYTIDEKSGPKRKRPLEH